MCTPYIYIYIYIYINIYMNTFIIPTLDSYYLFLNTIIIINKYKYNI